MGKSSNPENKRVDRIKIIMDRENLNQKDLAELLNMKPQNFSRIMISGKVTEKTCRRIIAAFPEYRLDWLMGYDLTDANRMLDLDAIILEQEKIMKENKEAYDNGDPNACLKYLGTRAVKVYLLHQYALQRGEPFTGNWIMMEGKEICSVCWVPRRYAELNGTCVSCGAIMEGGDTNAEGENRRRVRLSDVHERVRQGEADLQARPLHKVKPG